MIVRIDTSASNTYRRGWYLNSSGDAYGEAPLFWSEPLGVYVGFDRMYQDCDGWFVVIYA